MVDSVTHHVRHAARQVRGDGQCHSPRGDGGRGVRPQGLLARSHGQDGRRNRHLALPHARARCLLAAIRVVLAAIHVVLATIYVVLAAICVVLAALHAVLAAIRVVLAAIHVDLAAIHVVLLMQH